MGDGAARTTTDTLNRAGASGIGAGMTGPRPLRDHPLRQTLTNEVHARPPESLAAPVRATMLAMLSGEGAAESDRRHLEALCDWAKGALWVATARSNAKAKRAATSAAKGPARKR